MGPMNRLVLIDGNAILHRAYHALPPLTAPDGSIVNAVYGFTSILIKIFNDLKPTHMAVAFDRPEPTFRKALFTGYQAKRPEMDKELVGQIEKVHEVIGAFGIPMYEMDGYEADDIIGTLAKKASMRQRTRPSALERSDSGQVNASKIDQVIIVTGDKDILQLVEDERVFVYMPTKGLSEAKLYGEKEVVERLGVAPSHVVEYKALAGDPSDNYPGVSGIGPKTAATLVETFGSVDELYKAIKMKDVRYKNFSKTVLGKLTEGEESARLSRALAAIKTDVPVDAHLEDTRVTSLDTPEARKALEDLHFHSLLKRLTGEVKKPKKEKPAKQKETNSQQQQLL